MNVIVNFRCTKEEKARWAQAAAKAGTTLSRWLREQLRKKKLRREP